MKPFRRMSLFPSLVILACCLAGLDCGARGPGRAPVCALNVRVSDQADRPVGATVVAKSCSTGITRYVETDERGLAAIEFDCGRCVVIDLELSVLPDQTDYGPASSKHTCDCQLGAESVEIKIHKKSDPPSKQEGQEGGTGKIIDAERS